MPLVIEKRNIKKVFIIDDQAAARDAMAEVIEDVDLEPIIKSKQLPSLDELIEDLTKNADAAIFDHHLKVGNYANFDGAEAVAKLYELNFPALLITSWTDAVMDDIRLFRRRIPVLIRSRDAESGNIEKGLVKCVNELDDNYSSERRPCRSLIRIKDINEDSTLIYVVVPAWNPDEVIRLSVDLIPAKFQRDLKIGTRYFAEVNIGATALDELYFENFEIAEPPMEEYAKLLHS